MEVDTQTLKGICSELVPVREEGVLYGRAWSQARLKKAKLGPGAQVFKSLSY